MKLLEGKVYEGIQNGNVVDHFKVANINYERSTATLICRTVDHLIKSDIEINLGGHEIAVIPFNGSRIIIASTCEVK